MPDIGNIAGEPRLKRHARSIGGAAAWPYYPCAACGDARSGLSQQRFRSGAGPSCSRVSTGLEEAGIIEEKNVSTEYLYADGQYDCLVQMAADLIARNVAVIGGPAAARAATSKSA